MKTLLKNGKIMVDYHRQSPISNKHYRPNHYGIQKRYYKFDNRSLEIYIHSERDYKCIGIDKRIFRAHDYFYFDRKKDAN